MDTNIYPTFIIMIIIFWSVREEIVPFIWIFSLIAHAYLFLVCLGGNHSVKKLGAYCLGHIVEEKVFGHIFGDNN